MFLILGCGVGTNSASNTSRRGRRGGDRMVRVLLNGNEGKKSLQALSTYNMVQFTNHRFPFTRVCGCGGGKRGNNVISIPLSVGQAFLASRYLASSDMFLLYSTRQIDR